jgi:hypothetical protein
MIDSDLLIAPYPDTIALVLTCNYSECMIPSSHEGDIALYDSIELQGINIVNIVVQASWFIIKRFEYLKLNSLKLVNECE